MDQNIAKQAKEISDDIDKKKHRLYKIKTLLENKELCCSFEVSRRTGTYVSCNDVLIRALLEADLEIINSEIVSLNKELENL